jgi:hypothetical protein
MMCRRPGGPIFNTGDGEFRWFVYDRHGRK